MDCPSVNSLSPMEESNDDFTCCSVCTDRIKQKLNCGHFVHLKCIISSGFNRCPECRAEMRLTRAQRSEMYKAHARLGVSNWNALSPVTRSASELPVIDFYVVIYPDDIDNIDEIEIGTN